jgi:hypothetical protein
MTIIKLKLSLFILSFGANVFASNHCFQDKLPFFQNFNRFEASASEKLLALDNTCRELGQIEMHQKKGPVARVLHGVLAPVSAGLFGSAAAAFSRLRSTPEGQSYMRELDQIREIENPVERVRLTYLLAVENSGEYDHSTMGMRTWISGLLIGANRPENLLANNKLRGTIGVCREFAALLQWSLMQVARHPTSKSMALGAADFSSSMVAGIVPGASGWGDGGPHAWVRVNLPIIVNGQLKGFNHFDLDSTWYEKFTPLFPRRSNLSELNRNRAIKECNQLRHCIQNFH